MENREIAVAVSGVKKNYRLGQIGGGTLQKDLQSWWARVRKKEDPNQKLGSKRIVGETLKALDGIDLSTLTDGKIYMGKDGETMKAFDVKDGYGIAQILPKLGIIPVIITGRRSQIVANRSKELGITELYQGVSDKAGALRKAAAKLGCECRNAAYIGDDLNDLECMELCGLTACPADGAAQVKAKADYICRANGGIGAVREFIEYIGEKYGK